MKRVSHWFWLVLVVSILPELTVGQQPGQSNQQGQAEAQRPRRQNRPATVGPAVKENKATPIDRIKAAKDFHVELLYSVPGVDQGSWVNLCVDPKGRLIVSDQYGGMYRIDPPPMGKALEASAVRKVPADIRAVNGMAFAFGALYVGVNDYEQKIPSGLYRITDSDGDDQLDKVEMLRAMEARGDHGVHAVVPTPDGKALYLICGNGTKPTKMEKSSPVPAIWGEDHLLPRMPDGRGFMRDVLAPGGIVYRVSPDGQKFEAIASGFRNIFDAAINKDGELFTYDADMEYDFNTSWYRPTRINHVVSGAEYGWRNGAGKRPEFYADNLPATLNIGPGSPTGVTFGYGAKFPVKYQNALYVLDWSWGKLYAVHLQPKGASYVATKEEFVTGAPLPITDAIIHPGDGAMYFTIGGRRVQSGLYRVTYRGAESTASTASSVEEAESIAAKKARERRKELESFHGKQDPSAIDRCWQSLGDSDRFIRWAARTALEHQPARDWADKALKETHPSIQVEALLGLVRTSASCPQHRNQGDTTIDATTKSQFFDAWLRLNEKSLTAEQQLTHLRTLQIALNRFGLPETPIVDRLVKAVDAQFPAKTPEKNWLLCETMVFLQAPTTAIKALDLIASAPTQEEQIEYARSLRMLKSGWNNDMRKRYFEWFLKAANFTGGASFEKFIEFIREDAVATLTDAERTDLATILAAKPEKKTVLESLKELFAGRKANEWKLEELSDVARTQLKARDYANGRKMFAAAACYSCHRFANEGGMTGPDLTSAGRRYSAHDLLDQIVHPSKVINEQFSAVRVLTEDGDVHTGVVVNLNGDTLTLNTDLTNPNQRVSIDRKGVERMEVSDVSAMPANLLALLTKEEILDLTAYILSGGDAQHAYFGKD